MIHIVSPANQLQMRDPCLLQLIQCTQSTACLTTKISGFIICFQIRFLIPRLLLKSHYFFRNSITIPYSSKPIGHPAKISHLITVKRITECSRKLAHLIQHKGLELHSRLRSDPSLFFHFSLRCNNRLHIPERVFPMKDQSLQRKAPEHLQHFAVHFPCLSAEMDLTGNPPVFQINKKRRICNDIASKSNSHALFYDISDLRILFRKIIQGIEGEMHRLFIFFYHLGKNFQLTVCSKLNITAENLPAI